MQEAMKELRSFCYLTHPPTLQPDGLRSTLRQLTKGYADRSGLTVKFRSSPNVDKLPVRTQRAFLRIVQEALANVHRHSSATLVSVNLRRTASRLHLTISDNGRGVEGMSEDGHAPLRPGVRLLGIRARVQQLTGDLKIQTGPQGTRIQVAVPVGEALVSGVVDWR
jgi:two-component system, NarL family, sensor kinase